MIIRLLLRELYQRTDPEHPDYSKLKEAISAVQKQADMVNTKIKKSQASNEVISIQEKLVGDNVPVSIFNFLNGAKLNSFFGKQKIVTPSRYFICEGSFRECHLDRKFGKEFEIVYLYLFNDILITTRKVHTLIHPVLKKLTTQSDNR